MCIAAPAQIVSITDKVATVDFGGVRQQAKLDSSRRPRCW